MALAYGYGRVSTTGQEISLEVQQEQCRGFWEYRLKPLGVEWGDWGQDRAVSGKMSMEDRPKGGIIFRGVERGDHLIMSKLDRGFRSLSNAITTIDTMERRGVSMHFVDNGIDSSTPIGRLTLHILASFAEWERRITSERTSASLQQKKKDGIILGRAAKWGFKLVRKGKRRVIEIDTDEMRVAKRAYEMRQEGASYEDIAKQFRLHGIKSRTGKDMVKQRVCDMIANYEALLEGQKITNTDLPSFLSWTQKPAPTPSSVTQSQPPTTTSSNTSA